MTRHPLNQRADTVQIFIMAIASILISIFNIFVLLKNSTFLQRYLSTNSIIPLVDLILSVEQTDLIVSITIIFLFQG